MKPTIRPTKKQQIAWDRWWDLITKFIVLGGGAGGGKSWAGCEMVLTDCYRYPGGSFFLARNELKRLMGTTYKTWLKVCKHHKIPDSDWKLDGQYNIIKFKNGAEVHLLDVAYKPTDPMYERFGSYEFTKGFGDEINEWQFDAYDVLKSRIGRNNSFDAKAGRMITPPADFEGNEHKYPHIEVVPPKFLGGCNPAKNWVYQEFYKPWRDNVLPAEKAFIQSLYTDNPYTAKSYGEQLAAIKNDVNRQRLMDGNWDYSDNLSALVSYGALADLPSNPKQTSGTRYCVIDVAGGGGDNAIANLFDGWHSYKRVLLPATDDPQLLRDEVKQLLSDEDILYSNTLYDANGLGWALGGGDLQGLRPFVGSRSPLATRDQINLRSRKRYDPEAQAPNFNHVKSQCAWFLAEKINSHAASMAPGNHVATVIEDLTALLIQKDPEKEGKLSLKPKEDVRQDLGRSPDDGDTWIMRAWFDVYELSEKGDPARRDDHSGYYSELEYSQVGGGVRK